MKFPFEFIAFMQVFHKIVRILDAASSLWAWRTWFASRSDRRFKGSEMQNWNIEAGVHLLTLNVNDLQKMFPMNEQLKSIQQIYIEGRTRASWDFSLQAVRTI